MRFGIVIPVYNRPTLVCEALASVRAQTRRPDAVVVVDDGSTDNTADAVSACLRELGTPDGWRLLREPHRGAPYARDAGFRACGPVDAVAFLDSDDLWPADLLARAERVLMARPDLIGVSADRMTLDLASSGTRLGSLAGLPAEPIRWMVCHDAGFGSCSVIRSGAITRIGGYPSGEPTGHDILLFAGLFGLGPWGHLPGAPAVSRRHHRASVGEADHIARSYADANLRHARLYEHAAAMMTPAAARSRDVRSAMSRRWISAAKSAYGLGDSTGALECLRQARRHRTVSLRAARLRWKLRGGTPAQGGLSPSLPS